MYVLVNSGTFSAAVDVAVIVRSNQRGTFLGEEVEGSYHGNFSLGTAQLTLPRSKLRLQISDPAEGAGAARPTAPLSVLVAR